MKLLTQAIRETLIENGKHQESVRGTAQEIDFRPVVKLFTPNANCTWLLTEIDPEHPDLAFGLCDLGMGYPELGSVSLTELESLQEQPGLLIERDLHAEFHYPLSVYARAAQRNQVITLDAAELALAVDKRMDPDYQRKVGEFVSREVVQNVSLLVSAVANDKEDYGHLFRAFDADQARQMIEDELAGDDDRRAEIEDDHDLEDSDDLKEVMNDLRLDQADAESEVYEHWIVSDFLATRLEAAGECVARDFYGLTIWGRCTTGQAILLDGVICRIYDELT